jgi:hypothetical protein
MKSLLATTFFAEERCYVNTLLSQGKWSVLAGGRYSTKRLLAGSQTQCNTWFVFNRIMNP